MNGLSFTLVTDGSSDQALLPIISWLLSQHRPELPLNGEWADLARLPSPPEDLTQKIVRSCQLYPCDLLFVHRDAEGVPRDRRVNEIQQAVAKAREIMEGDTRLQPLPGHVCVIPVRMLEAWLLFDRESLRKAAANPNGKAALGLPQLNRLESLNDPKEILYQLLRTASELKGRRLNRFRPQSSVHRLAGYIDDFSPLRQLHAFQLFEEEVQAILQAFEE